ncbi:glycosyltransferase family 8 protein [Helicobacter sp. MIT 21-1697]|nr:glycosyltransferase family 8 protein [Helicobacter sp. MIT 21-1697]
MFHILSNALSQECQDKLQTLQKQLSLTYPCEIHIHFVDESAFVGVPKWGFEKEQNYCAYYRLILSQYIPQDVAKCLYLDVDMLVLCDVRELFAIDLGECIAGVNEAYPANNILRDESFILESTSAHKDSVGFDIGKAHIPYYFCSGLMLLNMPLYRANNIESQCLAFLKAYVPLCADQDALNVALNGKIKILPPEYGLAMHFLCHLDNNKLSQDYTKDYFEILPLTKIAHYNACAKPWKSPKEHITSHNKLVFFHPYYKQWWDIALQTPLFAQELKGIQKAHKDYIAIGLALMYFACKVIIKIIVPKKMLDCMKTILLCCYSK